MKKGDIVIMSSTGEFAGKLRPAVIIQQENADNVISKVVCPFTTDPTSASMIRLPVEPSAENGLQSLSWIMVDKITTARTEKIGKRIGQLACGDVDRLNRALIVFLGLDR